MEHFKLASYLWRTFTLSTFNPPDISITSFVCESDIRLSSALHQGDIILTKVEHYCLQTSVWGCTLPYTNCNCWGMYATLYGTIFFKLATLFQNTQPIWFGIDRESMNTIHSDLYLYIYKNRFESRFCYNNYLTLNIVKSVNTLFHVQKFIIVLSHNLIYVWI